MISRTLAPNAPKEHPMSEDGSLVAKVTQTQAFNYPRA
jgi:hypothetical protein